MAELLHKELSYKLNGIFFETQNKLGTKFQEKHYLRAVCRLLKEQDIPFEIEVPFKVVFNGETLGSFRADLVVNNEILVEFKATDRLTTDHRQQIIRYLNSLDLDLAILVNFRIRPLQMWRIVKSRKH